MREISRRDFLGRAAATAAAASLAPRAARAARRPNVLFILADDLGWGDLSCYGNAQFRTPNLDRLASQGTLFTHYYQGGPVCSPSRCSLLTGRRPAECRVHGHFAAAAENERRNMPDLLDPALPTLPRLLREAGYHTAQVGKWHLGKPTAEPTVEAYGFAETRWLDCQQGGVSLWAGDQRPRATQVLVDETLEVFRARRDHPIYCQLWLNDVHAPLNPSDEQMQPYRRFRGDSNVPFTPPATVYAAATTEMDRQLGRLIDGLAAEGVAENTLIVFSSDNGPEDIQISNASWSGVGSAGPLRGRKRSLYDGGLRVPFIVRGPGVPAGRVSEALIAGVDWLPTIADVAGVAVPGEVAAAVRGESFAPALRGEPWTRAGALMWEWRFRIFNHPWNRSPMLATRAGQWKLLLNPDRSRVELYDIPADPGEQDNLAHHQPELVERLAEPLLAWQATLPAGLVEPTAGRDDYRWPGTG